MWAKLLGSLFGLAGAVASFAAFLLSAVRQPTWFELIFNAPVRAYLYATRDDSFGYTPRHERGYDFLVFVLCWALYGAFGAVIGVYIGGGMDERMKQNR